MLNILFSTDSRLPYTRIVPYVDFLFDPQMGHAIGVNRLGGHTAFDIARPPAFPIDMLIRSLTSTQKRLPRHTDRTASLI